MKFTDGFWNARPGVDVRYAQEAYDIEAVTSPDGDSLVVTAPTRVIAGRGDTLNRAVLTVTVSSPLEGVVKVRTQHHRGTPASGGFDLLGTEAGHGIASLDESGGALQAGPLRARIAPGAPWNLSFATSSIIDGVSPVPCSRQSIPAASSPGRASVEKV